MSESTRLHRIAVHGSPRSGTTWLGEIINSAPQTIVKYQPLFSYALKDALSPESSAATIDAFFAALAATEDDFMDRSAERDAGMFPHFEKTPATHIVYKEVRYHHVLANLMATDPTVRLVACIRNPLSVINSWLRAPREFRSDLGWNVEEEWRAAPKKNDGKPEEFNGYERWKESARIFLDLHERHPGRVHIVEYRALLEQTVTRVRALFAFCGLEVSDQTLEFLNQSTSRTHPDAYSVYRSDQRDDRWKDELVPEIADEILADLAGSDLEGFARS